MIPLDGVERALLERVPTELTITVTSSPSRGTERTLEVAQRLADHGYRVVPHLAARLVTDRSQLAELLARIEALGSGEVFVVAGDIAEPRGPFDGAAALLREMSKLGHGLAQIGITGYPESHAFISDDTTIQAMFEKAPFATYIVSQICFDPAAITTWIRRVRDRGVELPIYVGLPGPIDPVRLLRLSSRIGLGESARFLRRHGSWLGRLTLPRAYRPEALLERLAPTLAASDSGVAGLHVFTFNELDQLERWRRRQIAALGGDPAPQSGDPASLGGDPAPPHGDPAPQSGDPASPHGDPASQSGDPASQSGDPASQSGDPASPRTDREAWRPPGRKVDS